jgi:hypothetical protein
MHRLVHGQVDSFKPIEERGIYQLCIGVQFELITYVIYG